MGPYFPANDRADYGLSNTEFTGKGPLAVFAARVECSDFPNISIGQLGVPVKLSFAGLGASETSASAFSDHVVNVISMGSLSKMFGVAAWRIITFVHDQHCGPRSRCEEKGNAMGKPIPPLTALPPSYAGQSISIKIAWSRPFPALTFWSLAWSFVHPSPESCQLLSGERGRVSINSSHVSLLERSVWLGSERCWTHRFGPSVF